MSADEVLLESWKINNSWTIFLDRDGTINKRLIADYVKTYQEFNFLPGALEAFPIFNKVFDLSIIVTNQQGVGKELMTEKELRSIHCEMLEEITMNGGFIDEIYYCTSLVSENSELRKPKPGMALSALGDFPKIDFKKSIMVGDTLSDMEFGKNLGMKTVLITDDHTKLSEEIVSIVDIKQTDLLSFAHSLINVK